MNLRTHTDLQKQIVRLLHLHGPLSGMELVEALREYYGSRVASATVYPNLDTLAEAGFVTKTDADGRTKHYGVTDDGVEALRDEAATWAEVLE